MSSAINISELDDILHAVGRPLNHVARTRHLSQGDPIYFVTHLPYRQLYSLLARNITSNETFATTWSRACAAVEGFYAEASELRDKPIWAIDELALNHIRDRIIDKYVSSRPDVFPCYLDRASNKTGTIQLHVNRTLAVENGVVTYTDAPSILAGRPGEQLVAEQIRAIAEICAERGSNKILLADSGFASGNSVLQLCGLFEEAGLQVVKVVGSIGSTKSREVLEAYSPECCIWFDLQRSGWVESRDFFMFLNNGTPIANRLANSKTYAITTRPLPNGTPIGFSIPYCAYGGRWFRLGSEEQTKQLVSRCYGYTHYLYDAVKRNITITELATLYAASNQMFLLPINFGDLDMQNQSIDPDTPINVYLDQHFKQFIT